MIKIEEYYCKNIPNRNDVLEAIKKAQQNDIIIKLNWCPNCYAGMYSVFIQEDDTFEEIDKKIPKVYGM